MVAETGPGGCGCGGGDPKDMVGPPNGAGSGGVSFCSGQGFSPLPSMCNPYAPIGADYVTSPPTPTPTCPHIS